MIDESKIRDGIAQAMEQHILLEIRYVDKHGKETVRLVRPDSVKGSVLFAYCMTRQAERAFVLSRIQEFRVTDQPAPAVEDTEPDYDEDSFDLDALLEDLPKPRKGLDSLAPHAALREREIGQDFHTAPPPAKTKRMSRAQAFSPLREGGAAQRNDGPWIAHSKRIERATGGVLRCAVDACRRMIHLSQSCRHPCSLYPRTCRGAHRELTGRDGKEKNGQ